MVYQFSWKSVTYIAHFKFDIVLTAIWQTLTPLTLYTFTKTSQLKKEIIYETYSCLQKFVKSAQH